MSDLARQQARLKYLLRTDPKNPEIKKLQQATGGVGSGNSKIDKSALADFINNTIATYKPTTADTFKDQSQALIDSQMATYDQSIQGNRARDLEEAKQEMANRGIPYNPAATFDPDTNDLYGKTIGGIDRKYTSERNNALNNANIAAINFANQSVNTTNSSNLAAYNSFQSTWDSIINDKHMTAQEKNQKLAILKASQRSGGNGGNGGGDAGGFEII